MKRTTGFWSKFSLIIGAAQLLWSLYAMIKQYRRDQKTPNRR
ncbi:hypothetical protein [Lentilactobacillus sp. SPB1-3]|uniref:Uncharacterized protein n=1 Tax=Lentilactobacillus terminaliae TaxID=3003483 RepID=A0ACD5DH18_9LACO|nr:hypothetical protein [Lentilactobacillus sp. SPB1-3]MCZ0977036.1 hypothetical protein [Lentilactobacillus sp. SPB1-3]